MILAMRSVAFLFLLLHALSAHGGETGAVDIRSQPSAASITIDGITLGVTPQLVSLPEGKHTIRLTLPGYRPEVQDVTVKRRTTTRLYIRLLKEDVGASPSPPRHGSPPSRRGMGTLVVSTIPEGLHVLLDGKKMDTPTPITIEVAPGKHKLAIAWGRKVLSSTEVSIQAGEKIHVKRNVTTEVETIKRTEAEGTPDGEKSPRSESDVELRETSKEPPASTSETGSDETTGTHPRDAKTRQERRCACMTRARLAACVARKRACSLGIPSENEGVPHATCRACPQFRRLKGDKKTHAADACDTRNGRAHECVCRDILRVIRECLTPYKECRAQCRLSGP